MDSDHAMINNLEERELFIYSLLATNMRAAGGRIPDLENGDDLRLSREWLMQATRPLRWEYLVGSWGAQGRARRTPPLPSVPWLVPSRASAVLRCAMLCAFLPVIATFRLLETPAVGSIEVRQLRQLGRLTVTELAQFFFCSREISSFMKRSSPSNCDQSNHCQLPSNCHRALLGSVYRTR